ncbi:hypothetical protein CRI70_24655 [Streptomyces sp. Ru87]|nr:hypothetical protein CRI70_24655 [Streptomyces sp. Ru87]
MLFSGCLDGKRLNVGQQVLVECLIEGGKCLASRGESLLHSTSVVSDMLHHDHLRNRQILLL